MVCDRCCDLKTYSRHKVVVKAQVHDRYFYKTDGVFYICEDCYEELKQFIFGEDEEK